RAIDVRGQHLAFRSPHRATSEQVAPGKDARDHRLATFYGRFDFVSHRDRIHPFRLFETHAFGDERRNRTLRGEDGEPATLRADHSALDFSPHQYLGVEGSTSSAQARMPPRKFRTCPYPASTSQRAAFALRCP